MKKKILFILAMMAMLVCLFAISASAAVENVDGVYYNLNADDLTAKVSEQNRAKSGYKICTLETIVIPKTVVGSDGQTYTVTGFEGYAFENCVASTVVIQAEVTEISNRCFVNMRNLKKVFMDFTNITSIGGLAFNLVGDDDGSVIDGVECWFYKLSSWKGANATYTEDDKQYDIDLSKCTYLGDSPFHNANIKKITIGTATESGTTIGIQTFRFAKLEEVYVKTNSIPNYFCGHNYNLKRVEVYGNVTRVGDCAFATCKPMEFIKIEMSSCAYVGGCAFEFTGDRGYLNNKTVWVNGNDEAIVDLSNVETMGGRAFASSNVGGTILDADGNVVKRGTNKVILPTELVNAFSTGDSSALRNANIGGVVYIDFADGLEGKYIDNWSLRGNCFETIIFGKNVTDIRGCPLNPTTALKNVIFLADNVALSDNILNGCPSGVNFYYKNVTLANGVSLSSNRVDLPYSSATLGNYHLCGIIVDITFADASAVTIGQVAHDTVANEDFALCPQGDGVVLVTRCKHCSYVTYTVNGVEVTPISHNFDLANGAIVGKITYVSFYEMGLKSIKCAACAALQDEDSASAPAIFEFLGVSVSLNPDANGNFSITQGYKINNTAYNDYIATGAKLEYGLVASVKAVTGTTPLSVVDGKVTANMANKTILCAANELGFKALDIKVTGIGSENLDAEIIMCLYVYDGETIYYLHDYAQDAVAGTTTYNKEA